MSAPGTEAHGGEQDADRLERRIAEGPRGGAKTWFDVLDVAPDVSSADLDHAYQRSLALVDGRSIGGYLMLDPTAAESARVDVEAAYTVLRDPERRRAYQERFAEPGAARASAPAAGRAQDSEGAAVADQARAPQHDEAAKLPALGSEARVAGWSDEGEAVPGHQDAAAPATAGIPLGETGAEERRTSQLKFLAPEPGAAGAPLRTETPRPGSLDVRFEAPKTDSGTEPATAGGAAPTAPTPPAVPPETVAAAPAQLQATATVSPTAVMPPPTIAPEQVASSELPEQVSGALIAELRVARGLSLDDVAQLTKVRRGVLQAIEEQDIANLPARVYLRGFLTQIGRVLKVDRNRLAEGYLRSIEQAQRG